MIVCGQLQWTLGGSAHGIFKKNYLSIQLE